MNPTHKGWLTGIKADLLHFSRVREREASDEWAYSTERFRLLTTACGRAMQLQIPTLGDRLGNARCVLCCKALGIAPGKGTPGNEAARVERERKAITTTGTNP